MHMRQDSTAGPKVKKSRMEWMDTLRGASILLVVAYHTIFFTYESTADAPKLLVTFNTVFAPLRMPLMVFLSGLLVPASLAKGAGRYISGKLRSILHPYLVWSTVMLILLAGASTIIGRSFDASLIWRVFYWPFDHMWFLGYLLIFYAVGLTTQRIEPLLTALVAWGIALFPVGGDWDRFWVLLGFFLAGIAASHHGRWWSRVLEWGGLPWIAGAAFVSLLVISFVAGDVRYDPFVIPLVMIGLAGSCFVARAVGSPRYLTWLRFIGRESLIYYVTHWPIVLVAFVILRKAAPVIPESLLFCLGFVIALAVGTVLALGAHTVPGLAWLFRFGGARLKR